jgi:molecular chaperone GrpE
LAKDRPGDGDEDPQQEPDSGPEASEPEALGLAAGEAPEVPEHVLEEALEAPPSEDAAEAFHQRARLAEDRLAEVLAAYRGLRQENDAYRDRVTKTIQRRFDHRHEQLLLKFIDILDNFDRALEASQTAGNSLVEGLILVRTQLLQMLQDEGLERIPVLGLPFDPHVSEAVGTEVVSDPDHNQVVVREPLRGYRIAGKIARASRVVIGEYKTPSADAPPPVAPPAPAARRRAEEPTLEEIIARAEALDPPAEAPAGTAEDASLEDAEPLWHDPSEDEK